MIGEKVGFHGITKYGVWKSYNAYHISLNESTLMSLWSRSFWWCGNIRPSELGHGIIPNCCVQYCVQHDHFSISLVSLFFAKVNRIDELIFRWHWIERVCVCQTIAQLSIQLFAFGALKTLFFRLNQALGVQFARSYNRGAKKNQQRHALAMKNSTHRTKKKCLLKCMGTKLVWQPKQKEIKFSEKVLLT